MARAGKRIEPVFSADWSGSRDYWPDLLAHLVGQPDLTFLEVGCFEGRATLWLLEHVLTHPSSRIVVVDTFKGNPEFALIGIDGNSYGRFRRNTADYETRIGIFSGPSGWMLRGLVGAEFDFVYIDGSHMAADVLSDAVLAWPLLKPGGILAFDDYEWPGDGVPLHTPRPGIDAFMSVHEERLEVLQVGYQVAVQKR